MVQIGGSPNVEKEQICTRQILLNNAFHWVYLSISTFFKWLTLTFFYLRPLKAFINERKHHKSSRKVVKQKKTHQAVAQPQSTETDHDFHPIHESSSQSSSFDIVGPKTPSSHSESDMNSALRVEDSRSDMGISQAEMDPHVARLIGSLTLSAASASDYSNEKSTKAAGDAAKSIVSSYAPKNSDSSDNSPSVFLAHRIDQYEGLSSLASQQTGVSSRTPSMHNHSTLDSPRSHKTSSTLTVCSKPSINGITHIEKSLSTVNNNQTANSTSVLISPFTRAPRRVTSTADISPYLTRGDAPISATRLKQLSLLETVADESARMSCAIAARAAMTGTNPVINGHPLPPLSVPPQSMMHGNIRDPSVIYSSDHPRVLSQAGGFQPVYNSPENNFHGEHDAFQVRSRTSQSLHRIPTHNPTGSINIHQHHLLAAMNGSRAPSVNPSHQYDPQFIQQHQPQMYHPSTSMHGVSMHPRHIPSPQMIHSFSPAPQPLPSAVASPYHTPSFNRGLPPTTVNTPYNPSLLSILNARSSQPPTVPAQLHQ